MYFKFGVDSFIWAENFSEKDLWIIPKAKEMGFEVIDFAISNPFTFPMEAVKEKLQETGIDCVCTTTLTDQTNPISPDPEIRKASVAAMKRAIDICNYLESPILGGVNYAAWGYLTKKPRTEQEWAWAVECMKENAAYAKETGNVCICVECVNRFETHFLNIAEDAVAFCRDVGYDNMKVHLDCFHMIREENSIWAMSMSMKTTGEFPVPDWCLSGNFLPLCMKSAIPVPWSSNLSIPALKSWRATAPSGAISLPPERIWPGTAWQI